MKLLPISSVTSGMVLAKPVLTKKGVTLLNCGTILTKEQIEKLKNQYECISLYVYETKPAMLIAASNIEFTIIYRKKMAEKMKNSTPEEIYALSSKFVHQVKNVQEISYDLLEVRNKDDALYRHCISVAILCVQYGIYKGFSEQKLRDLCAAALLHDIGKKDIPDEILFKPNTLTPEEFEIIKQHPIIGYEYLKNIIEIPSTIKAATLLHHENWDGTGYPFGKKGLEISEFARIIRIADSFDALITKRVYKKPLPSSEVIEYIKEYAGTLYDPNIVKDFFKYIKFDF